MAGNFHKLTTPAPAPAAQTHALVQPGGKDVISLSRLRIQNGAAAEFLSSDLFPGIGMDVWQVRAAIPMQEDTDLLASPAPQDLVDQIKATNLGTQSPEEQVRYLSQYGAPFLAWASHDDIDQGDLGLASIVRDVADAPENHAMPDGGDASGVMRSMEAAPGKLPPGIEMRVSCLMSGKGVEITITARNTGNTVLPLRIGWMPHFAVPADSRSRARLFVPSTQRILKGKTVDVANSSVDFSHSGSQGSLIGDSPLDLTFTRLSHDFLSAGPKIDLQLPNYMVRLTALSTNIRTVRIIAPQGKDWVAIAPIADATDTVADRVAAATGGTPKRGLAPGATIQYKLRMEVLPPQESTKIE